MERRNYSFAGRSRRGFSLIELLLVLVILAVLTTIVGTKFAGRGEQAKVTAAGTEIGNFEKALTVFEQDCGRYPTENEGLRALVQQPSDADGWKGPYLTRNAVPKDPWENEYIYINPGKINTTSYDVYSCGPNGEDGDDDDIGNWIDED
jgi:general secretion pathway protein G